MPDEVETFLHSCYQIYTTERLQILGGGWGWSDLPAGPAKRGQPGVRAGWPTNPA